MTHTRTFSAERHSVTAARRFATETLVGTADEVLQAVELMVSELATNCIRHVETSFRLTIHRASREIRVEVTDQGGGRPEMRSPGPDEPSGRGLRIVDMLSERWGVNEKQPSGKTVWFTLPASVEQAHQAEPEHGRAPAQHDHPGPEDPRSANASAFSSRNRTAAGPAFPRARTAAGRPAVPA